MSDHKQDASADGASFCACSLDPSRRALMAATAGVGAIAAVGVATPFVASFTPSERAKAAGVEAVVFDRGGSKYTGRVAALADGAREGGLAF